MRKRWLALLLTAVMTVTLLPVAALGDELPAGEAAAGEAVVEEASPAEPVMAPGREDVLTEEIPEAALNGAINLRDAEVKGLKNYYKYEAIADGTGSTRVSIDGVTQDKFKPKFSLVYGGKTLKEGTDYVIADSWVDPSGFYNDVEGRGDYTDLIYVDRPFASMTTIAGKNRWYTNKAIIDTQTGLNFNRIVIVWGRDFPDALAANAYAGIRRSPLLLCERDSVPAAIGSVIKAHASEIQEVVVIGGKMEGAIKALKNLVPSAAIKTIAGVNRYQTADLVTREFLFEKYGIPRDDNSIPAEGCPVFVTTGQTPADALSAASWSYNLGIPVLLVQNGTFNKKADTANVLKHFNTVYLLGDAKVTKDSIVPSGVEKTRLGGKNRYETSRVIADFFLLKMKNTELYRMTTIFVPGADDLFPDALAAGQINLQGPTVLILANKKHASVYDCSATMPAPYTYLHYNVCVGSAGKGKGDIYETLAKNVENRVKKDLGT